MLRKVLLAFFALLACLMFTTSTHAISLNFTKDIQNPIGTNFSLLHSTIARENGIYQMWFTRNNGSNLKLGYATSTNGTSWPTSTTVSVNDAGDNHDPSLFVKGETKYIYYVSEPSEGSGVDIKIKRSIVNGSQFSSPQQINLARQAWNSQKLSCPYVYLEGGSYYLFYCGTNGSEWSLGLAQSTDGINFSPCSNALIVTNTPGNSQAYIDETGIRHLLFHSDAGIEEVTSSSNLNCSTSWSNRRTLVAKDKPHDQSQIISPSLINNYSSKELFYIARGPATSEEWKLNRAVSNIITKPKIVIVPGFFASWNQNAILYNQTVNQSDWKIPSYIQEYKGIIKTLDNLGLIANRDYFVFSYDWRKSINSSADDLRRFLQAKIWNTDSTTQVKLIGHSMGGIVSRIYAQKYPNDNVSKVITAGSPHKGVVQAYQPLAAGEAQKENTFLWLGTKLLINLNRKLFATDRATVRAMIPSLYDLFPTFNFLKSPNGTFKPITSLSIQNTLLNTYSNLGPLANKLVVIYGNKSPTSSPVAFEVGSRSIIDVLTGDYVDGRPNKLISGPGDYLVPVNSSVIGTATQELSLDHGELIFSKAAIKKILDALSITYQEGDISVSSATQISPAIIIALQSPVKATLQLASQSYNSEDGIVVVPNAQSGNYSLNISSESPVDYSVTLAQVSQQNDVWEHFAGAISSGSEIDTYSIKFDRRISVPQVDAESCTKFARSPLGKKMEKLCMVRFPRSRL